MTSPTALRESRGTDASPASPAASPPFAGTFPGMTGAPELAAAEFQAVRETLYALCGISLSDGKEGLVRSRLGARLRALSLPNVTAYLAYVESDRSGAERVHMIDVLTTNKTSFFREAEHFRFLESKVLPALAARQGPIRIWSAGCSSGEEPYTLAMQLRETLTPARLRDTKILATDISTRILVKAKAAVYADMSDHGLHGLEKILKPLRKNRPKPRG